MRKIPVRSNDGEYKKLLKTDGPNRYKKVTDAELHMVPVTTEIVTGTKPDYGGGPSPDGFVMNGSQMLGWIRIVGRVVDGAITV